ncbi:MAG: crossover junction endodeoxyribonuclease RuvC [Phycisphaeraceae bacterium]|nr:crossover junction endodeoxyribonuclease RuvC [Phycisphaeraceae bacterium]
MACPPPADDDLRDHPDADATRRIVGIDPGLRITGYGVLNLRPGEADPSLVEAGVFRLRASLSLEARLIQLHDDLTDLLKQTRPHVVAVEKLYAHYKHPRTAILMAHARGVILLAAKQCGADLLHLPSTEVKKAVTGYGHASKDQMQRAVQSHFRLAELPQPPDVADALAIALTAARRVLATDERR